MRCARRPAGPPAAAARTLPGRRGLPQAIGRRRLRPAGPVRYAMLGSRAGAGGGGGIVVTVPDWAGTQDAEEAYQILRSRIDLSRLPRLCRDVTERVILASADFDYLTDLVCDEESLIGGVEALATGAPVIADSAMVAAGITGIP